MEIREGGFVFRPARGGASGVYFHGRKLGEIVTMYESNGRHCFRLGHDRRRNPRTYRGRTKAAEALKTIDALCRQARRQGWSPELLIVRAWDEKPRSVS